ncbi:hypothetical protein [Pseudomonas syringae]|uniref:hypothetical protein n=1 Tax=Pseudomonas syringae TaxID=317 RepID=UPI0023F98CCE|nr:hypothetical protein [Pseudomonas syringae]
METSFLFLSRHPETGVGARYSCVSEKTPFLIAVASYTEKSLSIIFVKKKNIGKKHRCQRSEPNGQKVASTPQGPFIPGNSGCYQKAISVAGGVNQGMFTLLRLK